MPLWCFWKAISWKILQPLVKFMDSACSIIIERVNCRYYILDIQKIHVTPITTFNSINLMGCSKALWEKNKKKNIYVSFYRMSNLHYMYIVCDTIMIPFQILLQNLTTWFSRSFFFFLFLFSLTYRLRSWKLEENFFFFANTNFPSEILRKRRRCVWNANGKALRLLSQRYTSSIIILFRQW